MIANENQKFYVHLESVTSTHVIVTFRSGFESILDGF
jgi:hypothetical protein